MSDTPASDSPPSKAAGKRRSLPPVLSKAPPVAMVIFGASGDLTARKILPALARLADRGVLDDGFTIIGVARTEWSDDEFRSHVAEATPEGGPKWRALTDRFKYIAGEYDHPDTFDQLRTHLDEADRVDGTDGNRLYYLATIPSVFGLVAGALATHQCVGPDTDDHFTRVVVEKPYGRDLESAIALDEKMHAAFEETQIFRIDHYMGKETVQNVLALRFANAIFEPIWNRRYIEQVQVTVAESLGVEHRGGFYETAGALPRHRPEPRHAGAGPDPHGVPHQHGRRPDPRREGEAPPGHRHPLARRGRGQIGAGPVRGRVRSMARRSSATARNRTSPRTARPRPTWPCDSGWRTGGGPGCPSTCAPASGCRPG